jgi:acyl dehydratase
MPELYFDDIPLNQAWTSKEEYLVQEDELVAFARRWDPLPMHTDPVAAQSSPLGGLIAPATYTLAVASALAQRFDTRALIIGGNEWKVKFPQPVRPGDRLIASSECVEKRPSRTKPDRGIGRFVITLRNQKGETVLEQEITAVVLRRTNG